MWKLLRACCRCLPQRYILIIYLVLGLISCYLMRVCVLLALNEMTFRINVTRTDTEKNQYCPPRAKVVKTHDRAEFHWDQTTQHRIILALFIGYIIAHVPAGVLADLFGGKQIFGVGILLSSVTSLCFPMLARLSPWAMMAGRVVQGFGQGVMFPSSSALVAKWAPPNERSTMTGISNTGIMMGNASGFLFSGLILELFPGWEPVYYIVGAIGVVWCFGWYPFCFSSPAEHLYITEKEREMIESQIALKSKEKPKYIPWKDILTSPPFLTANLINFGHAWALFTMINEMPLYMGKVLNFDIKGSALGAAAPHLAMVPASFISGYVCDFLIKNKYMTVTNNRKVFGLVANIMPVPFLLAASFAGCKGKTVIALLMVMMFFKGLSYSTIRANPVDLSPNYAGVLMGIMNGTGAFAGFLSPFFASFFITGDGSIEEWRNLFYLSSVIMIVFTIPFMFFGSGDVQPWNDAAFHAAQDSPEAQRDSASAAAQP